MNFKGVCALFIFVLFSGIRTVSARVKMSQPGNQPQYQPAQLTPGIPTPAASTAAVKVESSDLAAISLTARLPDFWCDQPRLWFVQVESILAPQKLGDEAKFHLIVARLGKDVIQQVSDIVLSPPADRKFHALKERLLTVYEESENRQFQKLLSEMQLGEQKPSQLLRRMRDLARSKIPDETLRIMWTGHLPSAVRAVLAVTESNDLEKLAVIADKIMETTRPIDISAVAQTSSSGSIDLVGQIAKLTAQVARMQRSRQSSRNSTRGHASRSQSRSHETSPYRRRRDNADWLCFYHYRFAQRAKKCIEPCNWKTKNEAGN